MIQLKNYQKDKLVAILLTLMIFVAILKPEILATENKNIKKQYGDWIYTINDEKATIVEYKGEGGNVSIPQTIDSYTVTTIGKKAFYDCSELESIEIPNSVTKIDFFAFGYTGLKTLTIPSSVKVIENAAFDCNEFLTNVVIQNGVETIGDSVFAYCGFTDINIPNSVKTMGRGVFSGCKNLKNINVSENNNYYISDNGILYNKDKTIIIAYPLDKENTKFTIPNGVESIYEQAFDHNEKLIEVIIPDSVTEIGGYAFNACENLKKVVIPNSVQIIHYQAFSYCRNLENINIPDGITSIQPGTFRECTSFTEIHIPNTVTSIHERAFQNCSKITNIELSDNITYIGEYAFSGTGIKSIEIPGSLNTITRNSFINSALNNVIIDDGVNNIEDNAFEGCSITSVTIPNSVKRIGYQVFYDFWREDDLIIYGYKDSYAENYAKENGYTFKLLDSENEIKKGSFKCVNTTYSDEYGFRYTDDYFRHKASYYNQHLATMSLCLAYSAYNTNATPYNKNEDYKNNKVDANVRELFEKCGFNMEQYNQYNYYVKPTMDDVACAITNKKIDNTTVIAIAVRGGGYESEWGNNFTVYSEGDHSGFSSSADKIYERLEQYITFWGIKGNIKIWITGFSRAGAVSNLLAAKLNNNSCIEGTKYKGINDVYAYCFATPAGADISNKPNSKEYSNIYNIVHYDDPVPLVAPAYWGLDRYGTTFVFPFKESIKGASTYENNMLKRLDLMGVDDYKIRHFWNRFNSKESLGTFLRKFVKNARNNITYNKQLGFMKPLETRRNFWSSGLQDNLRGTFNKLYKPYEKTELTDVLKVFWKEIASELTLNMCQVEVAADNLNILVIAHAEPTYYLSWMQSMDSYYVEGATYKFSNGSGRLLYINCPVDVYVYDSSNKLVGSIENEEAKSELLTMYIDENGQKVIYLPQDEDFTIKTKAREDCKTTITIDEYAGVSSETSKIISYSEIEMEKGEEIVATATKFTEEDETNYEANLENSGAVYTLEVSGEEIEPSVSISSEEVEENTYIINTKCDENQGEVTGTGVFSIGEYCKITAKAKEGYKFDGWYINDKKISSDEEYRFAVKENQEIEAKFIKDDSLLLGDIDRDGEITAFDAYTALEKSLAQEGLTQEEINILDIDKDGIITAYDAYLILSYSVGIVDEKYWK